MEVGQIQQAIDQALDGTSGYDDSVSRLKKIGMAEDDAMGIAALRHGLDDASDDDPNWVPPGDEADEIAQGS